jgi:hypothetical protein
MQANLTQKNHNKDFDVMLIINGKFHQDKKVHDICMLILQIEENKKHIEKIEKQHFELAQKIRTA